MTVDEELRVVLRTEAERNSPVPADVREIVMRGKRRKRRRTTLRVSMAAVAVVITMMGVGALDPGAMGGTVSQPAAPPASPTWTMPITDCPVAGCLLAGTYQVTVAKDDDGNPLVAQVNVSSAGWHAHHDLHRVWRSTDDDRVSISVYKPRSLVDDIPCGEPNAVAPDITTADVLARLTTLPQFLVVQGPTEVPAFGLDTTHIRVRAGELVCAAGTGDQYNLADIHEGGDSDIDPGQQVLIDFWVMDFRGQTLVVEARQEGEPPAAFINQLTEVMQTVQILVE